MGPLRLGIGGFIVAHPGGLRLLSSVTGATFSWIGLAILPCWISVLLTSARELAWFIPGGLSKSRMCLLYLQTFFAVWLYSIPVVVIQTACLLGLRSRIVGWRPTPKPQYQIGAMLDLEDG